MGGFAQRTAAALAATALLLTACGKSSSPASAHATVPPAAPTTTTPADPYAVPATIDAAYLNRVFAALDHVDGDAARIIVANKQLERDAADRLAAIYSRDEFTAQTNAWLDLLGRLNEVKSPPGDRKTTTKRIIVGQATCVFAEVERDYSALATSPKPPSTVFLSLTATASKALNPTPWVIDFVGTRSDGTQPTSPCH